MSNLCPQCGEANMWDAYNPDDEVGWRLWCRACGFDEHEDDHLHRITMQEEEE